MILGIDDHLKMKPYQPFLGRMGGDLDHQNSSGLASLANSVSLRYDSGVDVYC